jgi:hypothetical protein
MRRRQVIDAGRPGIAVGGFTVADAGKGEEGGEQESARTAVPGRFQVRADIVLRRRLALPGEVFDSGAWAGLRRVA